MTNISFKPNKKKKERKKYRKTIEWERLEIASRKLEILKGIFHGRIGMIKNRNGKDLTEAEEIKRWKEYTEDLYKKALNDQNNHDGVITRLETDIWEFKVKWVLGSITTNKASGGDGIAVELLKIVKDAAAEVLHSICQQTCQKTKQSPQDWKNSVLNPIPKKDNAKECSNC